MLICWLNTCHPYWGRLIYATLWYDISTCIYIPQNKKKKVLNTLHTAKGVPRPLNTGRAKKTNSHNTAPRIDRKKMQIYIHMCWQCIYNEVHWFTCLALITTKTPKSWKSFAPSSTIFVNQSIVFCTASLAMRPTATSYSIHHTFLATTRYNTRTSFGEKNLVSIHPKDSRL